MQCDIQRKPLFVPFQEPVSCSFQTSKEKLFLRTLITSLVVFLIAVTIISFATNKYEAVLREAMLAQTCAANHEAPQHAVGR